MDREVGERVPRATTPIVLIDDRDAAGPAQCAEALLKRLGYTDVQVLAGGMAAWDAAGLPRIDGYGSLVKAFGDLVRQHYATPSIRGADVRARQANAQETHLTDARPCAEFEFLSLPGADNYPGTELSLREWPASTPDHLWAINCFSRTRGIIGTTTLRVLGHRDVAFLEDGVMQWALERAPVVQNAQVTETLHIASEATLHSRAAALIARYSLSVVQPGDVTRFRAETDRTLYAFDLRPASGSDTFPVPGVRSMAGGQLLMHFENLIGTRNARIVLIDDSHRLRAAVTAFWLTQLNQAKVFILDGEFPVDQTYEHGKIADASNVDDGLTPESVVDLLKSRHAQVVDVGPILDYEHNHLPGAYFVLPSALDRLSPVLDTGYPIVFTSPDGIAASLAARDARERWPDNRFSWILNGTQAWQAQGLPTEQNWQPSQLLDPFDDDWGSVMRVTGPRRDRAWADYLIWERELSARVIQDPAVQFKFFEASDA